MVGKKLNLKALPVEEWEGATVILRESSPESWGLWLINLLRYA